MSLCCAGPRPTSNVAVAKSLTCLSHFRRRQVFPQAVPRQNRSCRFTPLLKATNDAIDVEAEDVPEEQRQQDRSIDPITLFEGESQLNGTVTIQQVGLARCPGRMCIRLDSAAHTACRFPPMT